MATILEDTTLRGSTKIVGTLSTPAGSIGNADIEAGADIAASKVVHRTPLQYAQAGGSAVADADVMLHIARGTTGTIVALEVAVETAAVGDSTVDVDLLKGSAGSAFATVLSSVVQVTSGTAVRTPVAGTLSVTSFADGDILKLSVDATVGTGTLPQGLVVSVWIDETPA